MDCSATWALLLVLLGGCASSHRPPEVVADPYAGPLRSRDVVEGGRIFLTLCTACHRGRVNPQGYHWSPAQMRQQIREGNRLMPPLRHQVLSDAKVEAVLAYLTVMEAIDGELPPAEGPETGDALDAP